MSNRSAGFVRLLGAEDKDKNRRQRQKPGLLFVASSARTGTEDRNVTYL